MLGWLLGSLASAWPVVTGGVLSMGPPVAADLDGDGLLEVVFPAGDGDLYIVDRDGSVLHQVPIATTSSPSSGAAVADLTGDDRLEIVVIGVDNFVYGLVHIIDADGTVLAQQNINQISSATPVIVDSDFDGANELYISEVGHPFPLYAWTVGPGLQLGPKWTFEVQT